MKLPDKKASSTHRVLVFGPPKSGKSLLAGKLAEKYKLIWIDLENGYDTLYQLPKEWQENIDVISIPDSRNNPIALDAALKIFQGKEVLICESHGIVNCPTCRKEQATFNRVCLNEIGPDTVVVMDSLSQLSVSVMNKRLGADNLDKAEWDDYDYQSKALDAVLSQIQQANYNVVVISHEIEAVLEDGKTKLVPIGGTRNNSRNVAKYFGTVVYAEVKNRKHAFGSSTAYAGNILTGSRSNVALEKQGDTASLITIFESVNTDSVDMPGQASQAALSSGIKVNTGNSLMNRIKLNQGK